MCQPITLVFAIVLLLGTAARAQPSPSRERHERSITVTGDPADPPHEIRAAQAVATVLLFKSRINAGAVEVDRTRVKILDAGEWSIIFEPVINLGRDERLVLNVPFADGHRAVFVLVSHVSEVDTRIDVARREQPVEACQAELAEARARCAKITPMRFRRAGWLTPQGVVERPIAQCSGKPPGADGLVCTRGSAYLAETWILVEVMISNKPNRHPWVPSEVILKGMNSGVPVSVRAVEMEPAQIAPGEAGRVFVELEPAGKGEQFVLELRDATGSGITIPEVNLSMQESKR